MFLSVTTSYTKTRASLSHEGGGPAKSLRFIRGVFVSCFVSYVCLFATGCATYQSKVGEAREMIASRQTDRALQILKPLAEKENDDQLVYLLDYAVALQQAGQYKESAKALIQAERISDVQDYTSLSKETASMLLSEELVQYKGDDYEKVLINGINAINYLMLNDLDSALVEVRRLNNKLHLYKTEAKRNYEQNPFAYYIGAVIWEADRKYDDAYIAYKKAYELVPDYEPLKEDLIRAAIKAQRPEELEKWQKKFPDVKIRPEWSDKTLGELVVIFQQGWGPRKQPHPSSPRIPKLFPVRSFTQKAQIMISGKGPVPTNMICSVQDVAIKTLDDQYAALITKRVVGVVGKAVVADQIRQKNQVLGDIAFIALNAIDRADLRQWSTLPETIQIARIYLKGGKYQVSAKGLSANGHETDESMEPQDVEIRAGKKTFLSWRSYK